ncbi:hypothetical protein D9753_35230 [Streptomyces dangxiongensis]|uniref:Uncharacterized protein n=1 Tax=Streptomyces dangxiongensis TaxID=1442032 RepID=A0A3G2JNX3_9ACTN|nr:hypothetical protein D9753_35230 [Streptomyces dangxiongensis]
MVPGGRAFQPIWWLQVRGLPAGPSAEMGHRDLKSNLRPIQCLPHHTAPLQDRDLTRTRRWIADEEHRQAEWRQGERHRPPPPDWLARSPALSSNGSAGPQSHSLD